MKNETNEQFARRMRAFRNGITVEEQKQRDFGANFGRAQNITIAIAQSLMERAFVDKNTESAPADMVDAVETGLKMFGRPAYRSTRRVVLSAPFPESLQHARERLADVLFERFPKLLEHEGTPYWLARQSTAANKTELLVHTTEDSIQVDTADWKQLLRAAEVLGLGRLVNASGWPMTRRELTFQLREAGERAGRLEKGNVSWTPALAGVPGSARSLPGPRMVYESVSEYRRRMLGLPGITMPGIRGISLADVHFDEHVYEPKKS